MRRTHLAFISCQAYDAFNGGQAGHDACVALYSLCAIGSIGGLVEDAARHEWDALLHQLDAANAKHAIIDLGALDYFGSIMLELLVVLWKRVSSSGGKLALCDLRPEIKEVFAITRLDQLFAISDSEQAALADF